MGEKVPFTINRKCFKAVYLNKQSISSINVWGFPGFICHVKLIQIDLNFELKCHLLGKDRKRIGGHRGQCLMNFKNLSELIYSLNSWQPYENMQIAIASQLHNLNWWSLICRSNGYSILNESNFCSWNFVPICIYLYIQVQQIKIPVPPIRTTDS